MKTILTFLIALPLSLLAHYPVNLLYIISKSEYLIVGEIIANNNTFFTLSIDSIIYGKYQQQIYILNKKDTKSLY